MRPKLNSIIKYKPVFDAAQVKEIILEKLTAINACDESLIKKVRELDSSSIKITYFVHYQVFVRNLEYTYYYDTTELESYREKVGYETTYTNYNNTTTSQNIYDTHYRSVKKTNEVFDSFTGIIAGESLTKISEMYKGNSNLPMTDSNWASIKQYYDREYSLKAWIKDHKMKSGGYSLSIDMENCEFLFDCLFIPQYSFTIDKYTYRIDGMTGEVLDFYFHLNERYHKYYDGFLKEDVASNVDSKKWSSIFIGLFLLLKIIGIILDLSFFDFCKTFRIVRIIYGSILGVAEMIVLGLIWFGSFFDSNKHRLFCSYVVKQGIRLEEAYNLISKEPDRNEKKFLITLLIFFGAFMIYLIMYISAMIASFIKL